MELKDIYKKTLTCRLCERVYGVDKKKEKNPNMCPICEMKFRDMRSRYE